jgi:hypothetical protein
MTAPTRLERDLSAWLSETAMPQLPDYANDILEETSRIRQRPRWSFVSRWLPIRDRIPMIPAGGRIALRGIVVLVVLGLLLAAIAAVVGSRRTLPSPFGRAGNGLLAFEQEGIIKLVEPETLAVRPIPVESAEDHHPRWSLDGTRIAFLRQQVVAQVLVVADLEGHVISTSQQFFGVDSDSVKWSQDGRQIGLVANSARNRPVAIYVVDAATGAHRDLEVASGGLEFFWRPPDGRELLFRTDDADGGLRVVSLEDGTVRRAPPAHVDPETLRPLDWTPDGQSILYQQATSSLPMLTYVANLQTGLETRLDVAFGHVSNDGTQVAGTDSFGRLCVVAIAGGPCRVLPGGVQVIGSTGAAVHWSPDDRWIAISPAGMDTVLVMDAVGTALPRAIGIGGTPSWQRVAP